MNTSRPPKRLNQTDISSYFTIHSSPHTHTPTSPPTTTTFSPQLPPTIQSSLLNVGMRVRKAVPEGYKTSKILYDNPTTFDINERASGVYGSANGKGRGYMELVPFCGISKVGGYMAQHTISDCETGMGGNGMVFGEGVFEGGSIPSSQESVFEEDGAGYGGVRGGKRALDEEEEEEDEEGEGILGTESSIALRPIAQARNRRPAAAVTTRLKGMSEGDFGEAPFLTGLCDMDFE